MMFPAGRPELRTRYLDLASGIRVRAVECGEPSAPMIVLLPGWGCSVYVFRENLAPLAAAGFHVVAADLKGHGLSDKPISRGEYRGESMRIHVREILDALDTDDIVLVGLSMGAALAAHIAAFAQGHVRGVVLGSPVGFSGIPALWAVKGVTASPVVPLLPRIATRKVIKSILEVVNGKLRKVSPRDVDEYWAPTQFPEFTIAMRQLLHEFTWDAGVPAIRVPALLISGSQDRLLPRALARKYTREIEGVRHIEVAGAGHVVYDEAPAAVNEAIVEFVTGLYSKGQ
jgi:pimeloyl-ACP methyl ester carboxylesterase